MASKDRITCHVLDTTTGRPARALRIRLEGHSPTATGPLRTFESQTDDDGRVNVWLPYSSATASGEVPLYSLEDVLAEIPGPSSRWTLRFDTGSYFGEGNTFFPEVTVVFEVREAQKYHVPLLLSPYSYTTYRGS